MQYEDILAKINDPFGVIGLAPNGYNFLMSASLGPHRKFIEDQLQNYALNSKSYIAESRADYESTPQKSIPLATTQVEFNDSLSFALFKRNSVREYVKRETSFDKLSFLLQLSAGIKSPNHQISSLQSRMFPSGGGLYTVRIYIDVRNVAGIPSGVYLFNPFRNSLDLVNAQITNAERFELHNGSENISTVEKSNFEILISTQPKVALQKYGEHAWKIILIEMGHVAQNLWLVGIGCGYSMYPCSSLNLAISEKVLRTSAKAELLLYSLVAGST